MYDQVYAYACYLPPSKKTNMMIVHKDYPENLSYRTFIIPPRHKNIVLGQKFIKKAAAKREFIKEKSVFKEF